MRKESREMPEDFALEVMDKAPFATLSVVRTDGSAYGLPISHARIDNRTFYFHCALEGEKIDAIRQNPQVCLSAVSKCKPTVGPKDGSFTLEYKSAIGFGMAELVENESEQIEALRAICMRYLPNHMDAFDTSIARSLSRTVVVRIRLNGPLTGKRKQYDANGDEMKYGRME
ncbi:MAG: pyridoxamine 5'-phosphate oxidase family protein [Bacteroidales bacterium]|nr:pyridoxamine 5'-phosphate oxidase family protein [Bacteroidales bacterium]